MIKERTGIEEEREGGGVRLTLSAGGQGGSRRCTGVSGPRQHSAMAAPPRLRASSRP